MQKQILRVPLGKGVETKQDPKAVAPTSLLSAQNCTFDEQAALAKRPGNVALPNSIQNSASSVPGWQGLATLGASLHALGNNDQVYLEDVANGVVAPLGGVAAGNTLVPMAVTTTPLFSALSSDYVLADTATALSATPVAGQPAPQGIQVYAYESSTGGISYQVNDLATGAMIVPPTVLDAVGKSPKCLTYLNQVTIFYISGSALTGRTITAANPLGGFPQGIFFQIDTANPVYCIAFDGTLYWVFFKGTGVAGPSFITINPLGLAVINSVGPVAGITDPLLLPASMAAYWTGTVMLFFSGGSPSPGFVRLNWSSYTNPVVNVSSGVSIITVASTTGTSGMGPMTIGAGAALNSAPTYGYTIVWECTDPGVKLATWIHNASAFGNGGNGFAARGLSLVTDFVKTPATTALSLCVVSFQSAQQATYFLMDQALRIHGKFLAGAAGFTPSKVRNRLGGLNPVGGGVYAAALAVQAQISAVNGAIVTRNGIQTCLVNLAPAPAVQGVQLGQNLHLTGGQLWASDGQHLTELGFHLYPEGVTVDAPCFNIQQVQPAVGVAGPNVYTVTCPLASQIASGSFIQLQDGIFLLFGINGATPSMPFTVTGQYVILVALLSSDTASRVAKKCYQAIFNFGLNALYNTLSLNAAQNQFTFTTAIGVGLAYLVDPGRNSQTLDIFQSTPGTVSTKQVVSIQCPAAQYLAPGQYFIIQGNTLLSGAFTSVAVWFRINGAGTAPAALGINGGALQVTLTGSETGAGVATAITTAINGAAGVQSIFTALVVSTLTNLTGLTDKINGAGASGGYNFNAGGALARIAGSVTVGPYLYAFVYRWVDATNQVHESAPSPVVNVSIGAQQIASNSIACGSATFAIPCCRATDKLGVTIEVYRSTAGGTTLYRVTNSSTPIMNSLTADTVTFHDTVSDDALIGSDLLYTLGALPNFSPPSASMVVSHQSRLFLAGLDNPNQIFPSQKIQSGQGLKFNPGLTITLDPAGGPIQAIAAMDDKVIAFKRAQIWAFNGDGPDPLGGSQQFSAPQLVTSETGCQGAAQVVAMPLGLMYASAKGIYLLNRNLQVSYIGAPVEAYAKGVQITAVLSVERYNQVRFYTAAGYTLVYDYYAGQWTVFTTQNGNAATNWLGVAVFSDSVAGQLLIETPGIYTDNGVPFGYQFETAWLDGGLRQSIQRVHKMLALLQAAAGVQLTFSISYDYDTNYADLVQWTAALQGDGNTYGGSAYGANTYGGQTANAQPVVQVRVNPPRHRCESIKFLISETVPSNQQIAFTELALEASTMGGGWRLGNQNVAG